MASSISVEELLDLFDHYWFNQSITYPEKKHKLQPKKHQNSPSSPSTSLSYTLARSLSEQCMSIADDTLGSKGLSPVSVLISTSKQVSATFPVKDCREFVVLRNEEEKLSKSRGISTAKRRYRRQKSKSLSELEFEEVKGFMDLGFVFTEEDKDSSLVDIIPGLQKLGKMQENNSDYDNNDEKCVVSRPYLSEAWEMLEEKEEDSPLINWKIPNDLVSNEIDMKNHIKLWAQTVAATVR